MSYIGLTYFIYRFLNTENNILSSGELHGKYYDFDSFPSETLYYKVTISWSSVQTLFSKKGNFAATWRFSSQPKFSF